MVTNCSYNSIVQGKPTIVKPAFKTPDVSKIIFKFQLVITDIDKDGSANNLVRKLTLRMQRCQNQSRSKQT